MDLKVKVKTQISRKSKEMQANKPIKGFFAIFSCAENAKLMGKAKNI